MAPLFDYKAFNKSGGNESGIVESDSAKAARALLKKRGLMVREINEKNSTKVNAQSTALFSSFKQRVSAKDISLITRQLASLIKANIPIVEALSALVEQSTNEKIKSVLSEVKEEVNEGRSLGRAMSAHPKVFDHIFVNMVEAGEASGTLTMVLLKLADLKEAQVRLKNKVISGMMYPVLMMVVGVVLVIGLFGFVIPKIAEVIVNMNRPIPIYTKIILSASDFLIAYWWLIFGTAFISIYSFLRYIKTPKGIVKWHTFKLEAPLFGEMTRMVTMTRFASTMSTLLSSGVPILTAMNITKNLMDNLIIEKAVDSARANITEGQSIAEPLRKSGEFPPLMIHMIAIGERTGELPQMLTNVAETYEEQFNATVERMTALLEPVMIIVMGVFVLGVVLAVFIPLMDVSNIQ